MNERPVPCMNAILEIRVGTNVPASAPPEAVHTIILYATMIFSAALSLLALLQPDNVGATPVAARDSSAVTSTKCNGEKYVYEELAGWGLLANDARDKFGDTIGGIGSAIALDKKSWKKKDGSEGYDGILYGLPDRGWNTEGTQNTQSRIHKFSISLDVVSATLKKPASPNFQITYQDTILLTGPDGTPTTGMSLVCLRTEN
jgi:hypothetical protein